MQNDFLSQYKSPLLTDNRSVIKSTKEILYMKATGIVRRIEEYGIIGQKSRKPHKHWSYRDF